ncbi:MAG: hypothetical protein A4E65_01551 [Syntrophorhabdus sp. PtaU1.Bin153]|nr:MAG: hypothetical protein A4E65_01551 [Syntrophorhabdus sp. PtaU1.Bin153]
MDSIDGIIVVISTPREAESAFLGRCGREGQDSWEYASTNGVKAAMNEIVDDFRFVLVNPEPKDNLLGRLRFIANRLSRKDNCFIWPHDGDSIDKTIIQQSFVKASILPPFKHGMGGTVIEQYIKSITLEECSFQQHHQTMLLKSIVMMGNEYLTSLCILCIGYLFANIAQFGHELDDTLTKMVEMRDKKMIDLTTINSGTIEDRKWWLPAFSVNGVFPARFEDTGVFMQMAKFPEPTRKDTTLRDLFREVISKDMVKPETVFAAYGFLRDKILCA